MFLDKNDSPNDPASGILAEGAKALPATLSGGALFASLDVKVVLPIFMRASAQQHWALVTSVLQQGCGRFLARKQSPHVMSLFATGVALHVGTAALLGLSLPVGAYVSALCLPFVGAALAVLASLIASSICR